MTRPLVLLVVVVARADSSPTQTITPGRASAGRRRFRQLLPIGAKGIGRGPPVVIAGCNAFVAIITAPGALFGSFLDGSATAEDSRGGRVFPRTKQVAGRRRGIMAARHRLRGGSSANADPLGALNPPPFLLRKLKNGGSGLAGNARFPLRQPTLLRRDKAAKLAAFPEIDGVIPLVAVFAGGPGFRLAKGVGLVKAAVKSLAPVLGQGLQNSRSPVGMGKGLPVGTVPGDRSGLCLGCPPPPLQRLRLIRQGPRLPYAGTWQFPPG